jgi:cell division septum initiation protein DivIVA
MMAVAEDYEQALRETDRLRTDLTRMEAVLNEHREHERNLKSTLLAAQKLADDIKAHAEEEARRMVRDAQSRSDILLQKTEARLEDVQREIDGLKLKRKTSKHRSRRRSRRRNTLEYVREQEVGARGQDPVPPPAQLRRLDEPEDLIANPADQRNCRGVEFDLRTCHARERPACRRSRRPGR